MEPPSAQPDTEAIRYRFEEFELDLAAFTLERAGQKLPLTPKVFDLLRHLIEQRGRVVTKNELLNTLWADTAVTEGTIPWAISHVRTALGQRGRDKRPIETVYGRGYRFVSEVEVLRGPPDSTPALGPKRASRSATSAQPPFVGRSRAMNALRERLAAASTSRGGICTLVGPPGIGKTRCMEELATYARAEGFTVWRGRATQDAVAPVFWPWRGVLRALAAGHPALASATDQLLAELETNAQGADAPDLSHARADGNLWFFEGISELVHRATAATPSLVLLDDLHYADAGSVQLLSFLAPELAQERVLVVTTQHAGRRARTSELRRLARHAERIELQPLSSEEISHYLEAFAPGEASQPLLCAALHRATGGNPLYLLQTVRALLAGRGAQDLASLDPHSVAAVSSASDILATRLEALDEGARRILEVASVLGEEFELSTLGLLSETRIDLLLTALDAAKDEGLVVSTPPVGYRFQHMLLRRALYDDLAADDRAQLHRRAAETLEGAATGKRQLGEIALHYHRSLALGGCGRAAEAAASAARAATRVNAFADAARFTRWALDAQRLDKATQPRPLAELLLRCAQLEGLSGRADEAERTFEQLEAIARQHGYWDLLVQATRVLRPTHLLGARTDARACAILEQALDNTPERASRERVSTLSQLSWVPPYALDMPRSRKLSAQALSLARELGDHDALVEALHAQLYAQSGPDHTGALLEVADELLRRDRRPPTWITMEALTAKHGAHIYRGDVAAAEASLAHLGRTARQQRWPSAVWSHVRMTAQRHMLEGEYATAEKAFAGLRTQAHRLGLGYGERLVRSMRAWLIAERDGPQALARWWNEAELWDSLHDIMPNMRPGSARLSLLAGRRGPARNVLETMVAGDQIELPKEVGYLGALANLGLLAVDLKDRQRAELLYEHLSPYPHHNTPNCLMWYDGSVSYFLAVLGRFLRRTSKVEAHFDDALMMNERLGVRPRLALTCFEYARFLFDSSALQDRRASARQLQARGLRLAQDLGMEWLAQRGRLPL